jgi:uncharacterized protein (TIGR03086 family)
VAAMPNDLRPGPDSPPTDELHAAEATLGVLQRVLHTLSDDDWSKQTPCTEFDVASLTEHLLTSITTIGAAAGADFFDRKPDDTAERQVVMAARPAVDAWKRRGVDGSESVGGHEMPGRVLVGILSLEFLVHAWDYAAAVGHELDAPNSLCDYMLGLSRSIITPQGRELAGFDEPVEVDDDAAPLAKLLAFTGRRQQAPKD